MNSTNDRPPSKRIVFDRRYGWVLDEWKDPTEAAMEGGRGMFCIVPLAKSLFSTASQSLNYVATSTAKALENPELLSPQVLHATLTDKLNEFKSSIQNPDFSFLGIKEKPASTASTSSSQDSS